MNSPTDIRPAHACLRLEALLRDQAQALTLPGHRLLRELAAARHVAGDDRRALVEAAALHVAGDDRRALVEAAALVLSELVDHGHLSDDTADRLWLALAGCAQSQHWVSRTAAEACIA